MTNTYNISLSKNQIEILRHALSKNHNHHSNEFSLLLNLLNNTINPPLTFFDPSSNLTWQVSPPHDRFTFQEALNYASSLSLNSITNWSLPSLQNLFSTKSLNLPYPLGFNHLDLLSFWSSSSLDPTSPFNLTLNTNFQSASSHHDGRCFVRCVHYL